MRHARRDYERIQDPENKIGDDEPVFLLRARDVTAPQTVMMWAEFNRRIGGNTSLIEEAERHAKSMLIWQVKNASKVADGE